jgi:hypothetical protein
MKFATNKTCINLNVVYETTIIEKIGTTKFSGLQIDNSWNWGGGGRILIMLCLN